MKHPYLRLHAGVLLAGATGLFGRLVSVAELPLVFFRVLFSAIVFALIMGMQKKLHRMPLRHLLMIGGCGALLSIHWVFYYGSIKAANVSIGAVCIALVGFFTAIIEPLFFTHKRISWKEMLLSLIAVLGIVLIFGLDARYRLGIALGFVSSLVYTFFSLCSKKVQAETKHKSSTMLLYEFVGGVVVLTPLTPLYGLVFPDVQIMPTSRDFLLLFLFASAFTISPFLLELQALRSISAFTVNLSYNLEPLYTILLAMLIFGEQSELNASFWAGVLLIVLSVVLQTLRTVRRKA